MLLPTAYAGRRFEEGHNSDNMSQMQQNVRDVAKPKDPRTNRTDAALRDALVDLLEEDRFDNLTVGKIARRARVNRGTFYRHFQDKYDLAANIIEAALSELAAELGSSHVQPGVIDLEDRLVAWVKLFRHIAAHARLYQALLGRNRDPWILKRTRESGEALVRQRLQSMRSGHATVDMPESIAIAFAIELLFGVIGWWLDDNMRYSPDQLAVWYVKFVSLGYFHAFGLQVRG